METTEQTKQVNDKKELTLEEAFGQLDRLVAVLEDRNVSLEDSFQAYQKGMQLLKHCSETIDTVEKKMLQIGKDGELHEF